MNDYQNTREETLFELLQMTAKISATTLDATLDADGISGAKMWAMSHLLDADGVGITQLADAMHCGKSNATQIVDRLEGENLVERVPNPDDRRSVLVKITDDGQSRYDAGIHARRVKLREMLDSISRGEQDDLIQLLQKLLHSVQSDSIDIACNE